MKKAIVTGATGYIGSNLVFKLINLGIEVAIISRKGSKYNLIEGIKDKITVFEYDMEIDHLIEFFNNQQADIVFHLASMAIGQHNEKQMNELIKSNIVFPTHVLEAMLRSSTKNIINTGTYWQNYSGEEYSPTCLYAATKESFEKLLEYYVQVEGFKAITLKLFDTYGPNDPRSKLMNLFAKIAKTGETLDMSGGGQYLDLVYIEDVIEAFIVASGLIEKENMKHKKYFVSSGEHINLKDLACLYEKINNVKLNINWGKRPYGKMEVMEPLVTHNATFSWESTIKLDEGIRKMRDGTET